MCVVKELLLAMWD